MGSEMCIRDRGIQQEIKDAKQELDVTQPIRQAEAALKDSIRDVRETVSSHQDSKKEGGENHASGNN